MNEYQFDDLKMFMLNFLSLLGNGIIHPHASIAEAHPVTVKNVPETLTVEDAFVSIALM